MRIWLVWLLLGGLAWAQERPLVWRACPHPKVWVVSLHGSDGSARQDQEVWKPLLEGSQVGLISVEWQISRAGDGPAQYGKGGKTPLMLPPEVGSPYTYLTPREIYPMLEAALREQKVDRAVLHGFSRGATQTYALAALDRGRHFSLFVAHSGGVNEGYPPTRAILEGAYGPHPLQGTRWLTVAGGADPHPERDGVPAMRRTAAWLREQGATVLESIEVPEAGHGALHRSKQAMARFLSHLARLG